MSNEENAAGIAVAEVARDEAEAVLRQLAGPTARLREDQWLAIRALVIERRRALVVQRTGWGKSAVYFVATLLLRARGAGPTVIVSPLLSLMRNQVAAADRAGIHARTINSANLPEWERIQAEIADGAVDVLLISPERLNNPTFRDEVMPRLAKTVGLLVVDEAHTISDWGHDFRPDYRRLRELIGSLESGLPVLATTATANSRVTADVAEQVGTGGGSALVLRGSLDRESLYLSSLSLPDSGSRLAWLAEHLPELPGSGIIYTLTVAAAGETADFLRSRGYAVASYTGRTEDEERQQSEQDLLDNKIKALVATSALGMGFDKPDLGFVVHLGAPSSPIAYYQQVGRAGRGVERAEVVLLPGAEDKEIWRYFTSLAFPPQATVERVLDVLAGAAKPMSTMALEPLVELKRSRLELMLKVLDADGAVRRVQGGWIATGEPWFYDAERYARITAAREAEQQAMLEYETTDRCRMEFLRRQLDDPEAAPCGRCDNCTGERRSASVASGVVEAADSHARRAWVTVEPRRQWPTGMPSVGVDLRGKIPQDEQAHEGRALARLTDLGWGGTLRELLGPTAPDQPVPPRLLDAMVNVLKRWAVGEASGPGWSGAGRPVGIVMISSRSRPKLVASLAGGIAEIGRLPVVGSVERVRDDGHSGPGNSAWRLRSIHDAFAVDPQLGERLAACAGPILLVDDLIDSGWTMAVVARILRRSGASAVLPLVLALAG